MLEDGRYMNVTKSVDSHPNYQSKAGDVRMIAKITGTIASPHPSGNPKLSRCIQLIDGDLSGWIPASLVSMVSTQAFPISMRRANSKLKKIPNHRTTSKLIEISKGKSKCETRPITVVAKVENRSTVELISKLVHSAQPWVVIATLLLIIFRRNK